MGAVWHRSLHLGHVNLVTFVHALLRVVSDLSFLYDLFSLFAHKVVHGLFLELFESIVPHHLVSDLVVLGFNHDAPVLL